MDASTADVSGAPVGSVQAKGDALPSLTAADAAFVDSLRTALASDPAAATRPGLLRQRVEAALGAEETARQRPLVHQVVAAAEDNLPGYLTRIMPLTSQSLQQLSDELATTRGWNDATAQRVTQIWAHALGFSGVADDWPQGQRPVPPPVAAAPADRVLEGLTALPPVPSSASPTPWPVLKGSLARRHGTASGGEPALGVARGYAGMSLRLYSAIVAVLLVVLAAVFVEFHLLVGALPMIAIVFGLRRALANGALVATASGVEFTPYPTFGSKPQTQRAFSAPWSQVRVTDGVFSVFEMAGHKIQVGPFNRPFARASSSHAGQGA